MKPGELTEKAAAKLKKIKVVMSDVDGILTDGLVYWDGEEVGFNRRFHVADGYGFKVLKKLGFKVGIITGGDSVGVRKRFEEDLALDYLYCGNEDKRKNYIKLIKDEGFQDEEILYIGDEYFDIPLLKRAGFSATIQESYDIVKKEVDYICVTPSGRGCFRELVELLLKVQNKNVSIPDFE